MSPTPRERRVQEIRDQRRKEMPKRIAKAAIIPAVVILVGVGIAAAVIYVNESQEGCPGHWHATFGVFVNDEDRPTTQDDRVQFPQPPYNLDAEGGRHPLSMHMHRGDQEVLHFEPSPPRCRGVVDTMRLMDVQLSPGELQLTGAHEDGPWGGTYRDEGNRTLRVFLQTSGEELRETSVAAIEDYQLEDGEKLLIAYGNHSDEEIAGMMGTISWPPGFGPGAQR